MKNIRKKVRDYFNQLDENGFSLLELVVAVGILLVLTVGGLIAYGSITKNARTAAVQSAADEVYTGAVAYDSNGEDYKKAETEWNETSKKDGSGKASVVVSTSKNADGSICVIAEMKSHNIDSKKGSCNNGSNDSNGSENGDDVIGLIDDCKVINGKAVISSEEVKSISTSIHSEFNNISKNIKDSLSSDDAMGGFVAAIDIDLDAGNTSLSAGGGTISVDGLDTALDNVYDGIVNKKWTDSKGVVSIDLKSGLIDVDSSNCNNDVHIDSAIDEALNNLNSSLSDSIDEALMNSQVHIKIPGVVKSGSSSKDMDIVVDSNYFDLMNGDSAFDVDINVSLPAAIVNVLKATFESIFSDMTPLMIDPVDQPKDSLVENINQIKDNILVN